MSDSIHISINISMNINSIRLILSSSYSSISASQQQFFFQDDDSNNWLFLKKEFFCKFLEHITCSQDSMNDGLIVFQSIVEELSFLEAEDFDISTLFCLSGESGNGDFDFDVCDGRSLSVCVLHYHQR